MFTFCAGGSLNKQTHKQREQPPFDDAVNYTQRWKSKLAEVMAWGNRTIDLQIRSATSEKKADTLTTPPTSR